MPPKTYKLAGASGQAVECRTVELARETSARGGYVVRGITSQGAIVRVPIGEAKLDGKPVTLSAAQKWDLAPERTPIEPGAPKPGQETAPKPKA